MSFAKRMSNIQASATVAAFARAGELKRQGVDLISLVAGEPDFDTPEHIQDAGIEAIRTGKTKYTNPASGIPELKDAICNKFQQDNNLSYAPQQIIVTCGAKQTIFDAIVVLIDEGDEVVIPAPYWTSYADQVRLMGGTPVIVPTAPDRNFCMTARQLQDAISSRTKMVMLNSPCNPTGGVYSHSDLQAIADVIAWAGIYVITDEIYEKLLYDGAQHISIASLIPELMNKTLTVNGVSKAYAMTGWRVGYGAGPQDLIANMIKVQSQETTNTCSISQYAALEALNGPQGCVETMRQAFEKRRNQIVEGLNNLPGFQCRTPQGAFYAFPDVTKLFGASSSWGKIESDIDLCNFLLDEARVACVPGAGFGTSGYLRFSYAASSQDIQEALDRIQTALTQLN
ncbi:MAG: pyridoxal phosphate-dependent aminotransferase [Candidatus Latescibacteria bacterium]|jgi:aspartate aminotransferase|nr:pyridoxal phosphate-dependent aminotransferase [Candidatus Latescibacterota bacterium]MBT4137483.1 pyridoxal phosphate-dependent aminotransferase [Candidatus Latescibacterota bacterium]